MAAEFRDLPSVDRILSDERIGGLGERYSHEALVALIRGELANVRESVKHGHKAPEIEELVISVVDKASQVWSPWPNQVINATGVILHTNLGRSPLSLDALDAISQAALGYSDLEYDTESGKRGSRQSHVASILCQLTGSQAAAVVNNNASAVMLGLAAVASGSDVIVSRGESVEIGGGFRIPDVLEQSGATLVEVGTTNRTYVKDYEDAISDQTAAILSVHSSNFRVTGFTHAPSLAELVNLGQLRGIPVLHDLGSGCLIDTTKYGLAHEPMPQESVTAGTSLAFFSGDKLLGGPQSGVIVGEEKFVSKVIRHPLARAVRIDKLSISALTATLLSYLRGDATSTVPVWSMIAEPIDDIRVRADKWGRLLGCKSDVIDGYSTIGGGSLPGQVLPTRLIALQPGYLGPDFLAGALRHASPPVIARIEDDRVLLDPRTVLHDQDELLIDATRLALESI